LNFYYYNNHTNIRGDNTVPTGFDPTIAAAFEYLDSLSNSGSCATAPNLLSSAALLEGFNSHDTTLYPWNRECDTSASSAPATPRSLLSSVRGKK